MKTLWLILHIVAGGLCVILWTVICLGIGGVVGGAIIWHYQAYFNLWVIIPAQIAGLISSWATMKLLNTFVVPHVDKFFVKRWGG